MGFIQNVYGCFEAGVEELNHVRYLIWHERYLEIVKKETYLVTDLQERRTFRLGGVDVRKLESSTMYYPGGVDEYESPKSLANRKAYYDNDLSDVYIEDVTIRIIRYNTFMIKSIMNDKIALIDLMDVEQYIEASEFRSMSYLTLEFIEYHEGYMTLYLDIRDIDDNPVVLFVDLFKDKYRIRSEDSSSSSEYKYVSLGRVLFSK